MAQTHRVVSEYKLPDNAQSNIRVFVRVRPLEDGNTLGDFITTGSDDHREIVIKDPESSNRQYSEVSFQFDKVFWTDVGQEEIFNSMCKSQIEHVLEGFNTCCFAYGQTGSGKTYSMFGGDDEIRGLIPRSAEFLFHSVSKKQNTTETAVVCSFLEIYNDQIRDLGKAYLVSIGAVESTSTAMFNKTSAIFESLAGKRGNPYYAPAFHNNNNNNSPTKVGFGADSAARGLGYKEVQDEYRTMNYEIHEGGDGSVYVKDLSMVPVTTIEEVMAMVNLGLKVRATHETKLNASSSRSHTVFTFSVLQRDKASGASITGMMNLVDLAGSERLKKSESQGIRLKEALHINTSLSALGKVIMSLDPSAESTHIPYRDAKLTRILQNSLGGNAYTVVLAAIHPNASHYDECLSTLQFANRCRYVRNNPRVNYTDDPADKDQRLRRQLDELVALRAKVAQYERNGAIVAAKESSGASISVTKLAGVLRKLGIAADIAPGGVLLVNGERRELTELGLSEGEELFTDEVTDLTDGSDNSTGKEVSRDKLKKLCVDLQEANRMHTIKFKDRNMLLQEQSKQIEDLSKQINRLQVVIKRGNNDLSVQKESYEVRATEEKKLANDMQRLEIDKLTQHNDIFVKKRMALLQDAPNTFKSYTQMVRVKTAEKVDYEEPLRREFQVLMAAAAAVQESELSGLKRQYDYFLKEKDKMLTDFAEKFTEYRSKKMEQLRLCEQEIIKLFVYSEAVDSILDNVEKGAYRVEHTPGSSPPSLFSGTRTAAGSVSTYGRTFANNHEDNQLESRSSNWEIVFPKGLRPLNLFIVGGQNKMKLAKKIVERHLQRQEKLGQIQGPSGNDHTIVGRDVTSAAHSMQNDSVELDPQVEQRLRDLLTPALVKGNLFRPKTSKRGTAKTLQRTSSSPGLPKSLAIIASREKSHAQDVLSATGSPNKGEGRGRLHTAPDSRHSSYFNRDLGLTQSIGPASGLFSRTHEGFTATWAAESKQSSSDCSTASKVPGIETGSGSKRATIVNGEDSELLTSRISQLKSEMMIDQELTTGVTNQKMYEYIQLIEKENKSLHLKVKEAHAELRTSKCGNISSGQTHGKKNEIY